MQVAVGKVRAAGVDPARRDRGGVRDVHLLRHVDLVDLGARIAPEVLEEALEEETPF